MIPEPSERPKNQMRYLLSRSGRALLPLFLASAPLLGQGPAPAAVHTYDEYVTYLADPERDGRLPGTEGMEEAMQFVERRFEAVGLSKPFADGASYRQPFPLGDRVQVRSASLTAAAESPPHGEGWSVTPMGTAGSVSAPVVFCGYGIEKGPGGYRGFPEGADLTGKIALIFRFEPMDEAGKSLWVTRRGPWTSKASFSGKLDAVAERGAAAVVVVNTPGADDRRADDLMSADQSSSSRRYAEVPVLMMMPDTAARLLSAAGVQEDLLELRRQADAAGVVRDLGFEMALDVQLDVDELTAENVIGLLPGRGVLQDEYVVLGAHLDHLGMGNFGSRSGPGELHPGADDNASGSAAVLMLAERTAQRYAALPDDAAARSILFMCFSAEESGLNGSRYYTENPIVPIEQHDLMINFDMIGRIQDKRLSVSGAQTGEGMAEWLAPYFDASGLVIVQPENMSGASDHTPFYQAGMPVLFGIIADFHEDYHTPEDVVAKINREDAVLTVELFDKVLFDAALRPELFPYVERRREHRSPPAPEANAEAAGPRLGVHFGVRPGNYDGAGGGVLIAGVTEGSCAAEAGILEGDRLTRWNGKEIADVAAWVGMLEKHSPGDKVQVTLSRDGAEKVFWVTLKARPEEG